MLSAYLRHITFFFVNYVTVKITSYSVQYNTFEIYSGSVLCDPILPTYYFCTYEDILMWDNIPLLPVLKGIPVILTHLINNRVKDQVIIVASNDRLE